MVNVPLLSQMKSVIVGKKCVAMAIRMAERESVMVPFDFAGLFSETSINKKSFKS